MLFSLSAHTDSMEREVKKKLTGGGMGGKNYDTSHGDQMIKGCTVFMEMSSKRLNERGSLWELGAQTKAG